MATRFTVSPSHRSCGGRALLDWPPKVGVASGAGPHVTSASIAWRRLVPKAQIGFATIQTMKSTTRPTASSTQPIMAQATPNVLCDLTSDCRCRRRSVLGRGGVDLNLFPSLPLYAKMPYKIQHVPYSGPLPNWLAAGAEYLRRTHENCPIE